MHMAPVVVRIERYRHQNKRIPEMLIDPFYYVFTPQSYTFFLTHQNFSEKMRERC